MTRVIRVLVVDDSAFVRKVVSQMLRKSPFIDVVGTARDGTEALEMVERVKPDVITLDLMMSPMDGIEFLRRQMAKQPIPVVTCSIAHESGALALDAFDAGAVEFVQKPTALATDRLLEIGDELIAKVKAAADVRLEGLGKIIGHVAPSSTPPRGNRATPTPAESPPAAMGQRKADIVVIGISTGGPQALRHFIPQLPAGFPTAVAIALHMPVGYTEMFASRLNDISALTVAEAVEGEEIIPGRVYLAPAGLHLTFRRDGTAVRAHLDVRPIDTQHRPSVDVLFASAAEVFGASALGVVMTGMGNDGLLGAAQIKAAGGQVLTESESSCVVYGMPRAVDEAYISDRSVPLDEMAAVISESV